MLDSGKSINKFQIAYQTYGELNSNKDNAILICHALTGDQFPAEESPITKKNGWWDLMVGPNKPCLLYTSPSPRDRTRSRMPSSA